MNGSSSSTIYYLPPGSRPVGRDAMLAKLRELSFSLSVSHMYEETSKLIVEALPSVDVDWDTTLRVANRWYDRVASAGRKPTRRRARQVDGRHPRESPRDAKGCETL